MIFGVIFQNFPAPAAPYFSIFGACGAAFFNVLAPPVGWSAHIFFAVLGTEMEVGGVLLS